jgi:ABC-type glycerol-3-phosphate transport system substrate-binding protein
MVAAVGLAAIGLAGCSGGGGGQEGSATKGTVNWWGWTPDVSVAKNYIAEFNKKYPDIKVNYKMIAIDDYEAALRPALASPSGPDIFDLQPGTRVTAFKGFAEDLAPVAKAALGAGWKSKVSQQGVDGLMADGKLTSLSVGAVYAGNLWINKGLFDKYNVKVPTTIDEWKQACATFKQNNVGCFVQGAAGEGFDQDTLQAIADSIEPGLFAAAEQQKKKWNDPNMVKTFQVWKSLFDDGIMQPGAIGYAQYPDANNDFLTGKYAMVMMGTWYMQYATQQGMNSALSAAGVSNPTAFPVVPVPFPKAGSHDPIMFGDADYGLAISKKSKNTKAAETFVKWLTLGKDGQQLVANTLNDIPALKGVSPEWDNIKLVDKAQQQQALQELIQRANDSKETRFLYIKQDVSDGILKAATGVADGSVSPKDAMDQLQQTAAAAQ